MTLTKMKFLGEFCYNICPLGCFKASVEISHNKIINNLAVCDRYQIDRTYKPQSVTMSDVSYF